MAHSSKYGKVTVEHEPGNPFGEDEPVFIIRGRDKVACLALVAYRHAAVSNGAGDAIDIGMVEELSNFRAWQKANFDLVKIPD